MGEHCARGVHGELDIPFGSLHDSGPKRLFSTAQLNLLSIIVLKTLRSLFVSAEPPREEIVSPEVRRAQLIHTHLLSAVSDHALSESEIAATVLAEALSISGELVTLAWPFEIEDAFDRLKGEQVGFRRYVKDRDESFRQAYAEGVRFSLRRPDWHFTLSDDFIKSVERIDRKLQGRVLEAITKIAQSPTTVVGDTVKPLTADLKGLWRYRVGDYRLVYALDIDTNHVTLLTFEARGGVYA